MGTTRPESHPHERGHLGDKPLETLTNLALIGCAAMFRLTATWRLS